jgi:glycerate kinase
VATGAEVVLVAAGGASPPDGGAGAIAAIEAGGGLGRARLVVLADAHALRDPGAERRAIEAGRDPVRASPLRKEGIGLAGALCAAFGAELRPGAQFVLGALDFDDRMRAAWAVVAGEGRLDRSTLDGKLVAEVATRARQAGVPAHAIVGVDALHRFDARILDLQEILTGSGPAEIRAAGRALAERLRGSSG